MLMLHIISLNKIAPVPLLSFLKWLQRFICLLIIVILWELSLFKDLQMFRQFFRKTVILLMHTTYFSITSDVLACYVFAFSATLWNEGTYFFEYVLSFRKKFYAVLIVFHFTRLICIMLTLVWDLRKNYYRKAFFFHQYNIKTYCIFKKG